jgi:hypothetical protein
MALLTISGGEEVAHGAAQLLQFDLVTEARLAQWIRDEFGDQTVPVRAWRSATISILARMAAERHLVIALKGSESLFQPMPMLLRAGVMGPKIRPRAFDLVLNPGHLSVAQMAELLAASMATRDHSFLPAAVEAQIQFQTRSELARHRIVPAGRAQVKRAVFGHPSEEMFANLLDFYRIQWDYEPRSFPLQWDKDGKVLEAFTPDFYLSEMDLYVELTTMKQTLVTRKNRKVKLLRAIYPHINIQVFYQKDFQDLIFKYGLRMAAP